MFTLLIYSAAGRRCETKRVQTLARIESQGVDVANGSNHLKLRFHGRRSVMPRHPCDEIKEPLRKAILKQLGLS